MNAFVGPTPGVEAAAAALGARTVRLIAGFSMLLLADDGSGEALSRASVLAPLASLESDAGGARRATVWQDGQIAWGPEFGDDCFNRALVLLGVVPKPGRDAVETLRLEREAVA